MPEYWCIRVRVGDDRDDHAQKAWDRDEAGVWYGASTAQDCINALAQNEVPPTRYLRTLRAQQDLAQQAMARGDRGWAEVKDRFFAPAIRFAQISVGDWVIVFFKETQEIGVAQIFSIIQSDENHRLNLNGEIFKFRKLCNKRIFRLSHLPDAYHLLSAQGRGNVYRFNGMQNHVSLLVQSQTEKDVSRVLGEISLEDFLCFLGDAEWESFCTAYLIIEEGFVPTGLSTGRTLPVVDIVGRRRRDGSRIYAQCKKDPNPQQISNEFLALCNTLDTDDTAYFFAYGGCSNGNQNIKVFDKKSALEWAETEHGRRYIKLFTAA